MKIPSSCSLSSPFFENYFCLIPNTNAAFVAISKNGVTFLKKVAIYNKTGTWPKTAPMKIHDYIGYDERSEYLIPVDKVSVYENTHGRLLKFAVWRDPVERIESTYKLFCLEREYRGYFHTLGLYKDPSFDRFMEFMEFEWKKPNPLWQDEHIRRQVDYYEPEDVDIALPLSRLYNFLEENEISFCREQTNKTSVSFTIKSELHLEKIKQYYAEDYLIRLNYGFASQKEV